KPVIFILALIAVAIWSALGPFFDYSETWQLVINTGTTIITFLMVFVLQNAQTRTRNSIGCGLPMAGLLIVGSAGFGASRLAGARRS
ncbi:low affinity iron permease family protein, partial [Rhizobium ruizarguesonis]